MALSQARSPCLPLSHESRRGVGGESVPPSPPPKHRHNTLESKGDIMEGWNITEEHAGTQHHETQRGKGEEGGERGGFVCWRGGGECKEYPQI